MIRKKTKERLETATTLQKAQMVCLEYRDKRIRQKAPSINDDEKLYILEHITDDEVEEFNKYVSFYHSYVRIASIFGLCNGEYEAVANRLLGYLQVWEAYRQEEQHLNKLYAKMVTASAGEGSEDTDKLFTGLYFDTAKVVVADGRVRIDVYQKGGLYEHIQSSVKDTVPILMATKALLQVIEKYAHRTKSLPMMPETLKESIRDAKTDKAPKLNKRYSKKLLDARRAKGEAITDEETKEAIFPYYEDIEVDKVFTELWTKKIKEVTYE